MGDVGVERIDVLIKEDGIGTCAEIRVGEVLIAIVCAAPGALGSEGKDGLP